ncbi:MAG: aminopeptidase P family protein [Gammaproteobacteria bacterium]|nr:aminopeptidase P family protein [Gammaproteobacteria bacterium]MYD76607.1 aminopeptidase P family protein [Gammaproteobacteria bacterium]MYJ51766.1 aminopeptidase P family protein [Gammaproteobacteria bacterium]
MRDEPISALRKSLRRKPDNTPDQNDRVEIGPSPMAFEEWSALGLECPDMPALREYRLARVREQLRKNDCAGILLFDPLNHRYATDSTNMQVWIMHNSARACFIATEGPVVLFDFHNCQHLSQHLPLVDEIRDMTAFFYFIGGDRCEERADRFAAEIDDLVRQHGGGNRRVAIDRIEIVGIRAMERRGIEILDHGMEIMEIAREIKNGNEIRAMRCAVAACEASMRELEEVIAPGISENELWAYLHFGNIRRGGDWIETRILSSGPRTNPWMAECGPRIIREGDLVALDTDLIGVYGYCVDVSRTWIAGDVQATPEQRELFRVAHEHILENTALLRPGLSFRELTFDGHRLPEKYRPQRYGVKYHGVGLCDEYPAIAYPEDWEKSGYDGELRPGMCLCVEAYVGEVGGREGIKLEEQVVITEDGYEKLSNYPFDERFLP